MKQKLFISYSHADESFIERFIKVISPLEDNGILEYWYDRNIKAGDEFWDEINNHLADRDIVCLFLSQDYLASKSCKEEMRRALLMNKEHGVLIIPIVLKPCQWLDIKELSSKLAATKEGKPISKYDDADDAWMEVYKMMKDSVMNYKKLKESSFSSEHEHFLDDATILKKAHSMKNELKLSDIFIFPDLTIIDNKDNDKKILILFEEDHEGAFLFPLRDNIFSILLSIGLGLRRSKAFGRRTKLFEQLLGAALVLICHRKTSFR
jgi:hypothetical protein